MKRKPRAIRRKSLPARKKRPIATTSDILTGAKAITPASRNRIKRKWLHNYRHLLELRSHLMDQMGKLAEQANEETDRFGMHIADAGTDSFDRDFALSLLSSDQNALYEIEEAIKRIEAGSYGICEVSGKPIPRERLNAIPWTRFSVQAQRQLERDGMVGRARFGELGSIEDAGVATPEPDEEDEKGSGDKSEV